MPFRFELTEIMHVLSFSKSGIVVWITKMVYFYLNLTGALNLHIVAVGRSAFWSGDYIRIWKETMLTCLKLLSSQSSGRTQLNAGSRLSFTPGATNLYVLRTWIVVVT
jgi:hypothetical protein